MLCHGGAVCSPAWTAAGSAKCAKAAAASSGNERRRAERILHPNLYGSAARGATGRVTTSAHASRRHARCMPLRMPVRAGHCWHHVHRHWHHWHWHHWHWHRGTANWQLQLAIVRWILACARPRVGVPLDVAPATAGGRTPTCTCVATGWWAAVNHGRAQFNHCLPFMRYDSALSPG